MLLTVAGTASAQYKIDTWTTEQGLPQNAVINAVQTPDGFIWAATLGGLVRFDGVRFRVFDTSTNPELPNSRLAAVHVIGTGDLWVVTQDRQLLRFRGGAFHVMGPEDGYPGGLILRGARLKGRLVFQTSKGTVIEDNGRLAPDTRPSPPRSLALTAIGDAPDGATWYVDRAGMGYRYEDDRLTRTVALPPDRFELVREDVAGRVWMRNVKGELICVIGDKVSRYGPKDGVTGISSMMVLEEPDGTIWFSEASGLVRFRDGRFRTFTKDDGLPSNYVNSAYRDREGSLWVATQRGLSRMSEQPITSYSVAQGLTASNTYPILQDRRGDIWIGTWPGLTRYRNGVFEDMTRASDVANHNVLSLAETRDGSIWVGLYGTGIRRLTIAGPDAHIASVASSAPNIVYAIFQNRAGSVWAGADEGAYRLHDGVVDPPLPHTEGASAFYEDDRGALWIGRTAGLARYANGVVTEIGATDGFPGKRVRMIYPTSDGSLWLGTYDSGLFRYRDGTFTRFTTAEGLPANGAFQILEDAQQRFWISSNSGIYRVAKSELDAVAAGRQRRVMAVRYGHGDGMLNQECNGLGRPAGISAADGRFWFPTQDGVVALDPRTAGQQPAPPVAILDAAVGGIPVPSLDRIEIRSGSRAVDVHYAALTFVRPELAQFKYRMENLETEWHDDAGTDRIARYARLPYGDFRFRVIAANRDGVWNDVGASIAVIVVPPFWRTTWFMALMIGAVMAAAFGAHRVRLGVLERKRALQEAFARRLIDSQETDRRRIAAELHDGVSQTLVVIKNWARTVEQTLPEDNASRQKMSEIGGAASQALGEVREVVQDLVPYHLERMGLAEAIREAAARVADASGIQITCNLENFSGELRADTALKVFRVAQEGLNNIVKHSGARTAAFDLALDAGRVRLTMRDDGKGFDPDAVTPTTAGDGFGLVGMQERARMMGGDMTIVSAPGQGTTIRIVIPITA